MIYLVSASKTVAWKRSKEEKWSFHRVLPCVKHYCVSKTDIQGSDTADKDLYRALNTGGVAVCPCGKHSCDCTPRFPLLCCGSSGENRGSGGGLVVAGQDFVEICLVLFYDPFTPQSKFSHEVCSLSKHGYNCLNSDWLIRLVSGFYRVDPSRRQGRPGSSVWCFKPVWSLAGEPPSRSTSTVFRLFQESMCEF